MKHFTVIYITVKYINRDRTILNEASNHLMILKQTIASYEHNANSKFEFKQILALCLAS